MNKNIEKSNGKLFYAVVGNFQGNGEEKLILHEVTLSKEQANTYCYGARDVLVVSPDSVVFLSHESPKEAIGEYIELHQS